MKNIPPIVFLIACLLYVGYELYHIGYNRGRMKELIELQKAQDKTTDALVSYSELQRKHLTLMDKYLKCLKK